MTVLVLAMAAALAADVEVKPGEMSPMDAVRKVRVMRTEGKIPADRAAVIRFAAGRHSLSETVALGPEDSNLVLTGPESGKAALSGGVRVKGFSVRKDGLWEVAAPEFPFEQLWVNGERAQRARTPNKFYLYMRAKDVDAPNRAFVAFDADAAMLAKIPADERENVKVALWQSWDMGYSRLISVDPDSCRVETAQNMGRGLFHWSRTCPRYAVENFRAALDAPGEWFHDVKAGKILYMPRKDEDPAASYADVPRIDCAVAIAGSAATPVKDVTFRRLSFENFGWIMPKDGQRNGQSAINVNVAAIKAENAERVAFESVRVAHVGAHGIWLGSGVKNSRINHALVEDLGAGGVLVGSTKWDAKRPEGNAAFVSVTDSIIRHGGRTMQAGCGVWLGHVHDCEIVHNDIYDFFYTGISVGWTWGYRATPNRRNMFGFNHIHHIGQGVLSDMGGFYSLGDGEGSHIYRNWVHDVYGYLDNGSPAWGLYTDEGSHGYLFSSNLTVRCRDGAIHQHYGKENTFINNLGVDFERFGVWRSRHEKHLSISVLHNVFWWRGTEAGAYSGNGGPTDDIVAASNVFWCAGGSVGSKAFRGDSWEKWSGAGLDAGSVIADPMFVDPDKEDWRLKPGSPALKLGFVEFDWKEAGVYKTDAKWVANAAKRTWDDFEDAPKAPKIKIESAKWNCERLPLGEIRSGMDSPLVPLSSALGRPDCGIVVSDCWEGKKALKLIKKPGLPFSWQPHVSAKFVIDSGTVSISFAIKNEKAANVIFETRDYRAKGGGEYDVGSLLALRGGKLFAENKKLCDMPDGTWAKVEILATLSGKDSGKWSVTATPRGGSPSRLEFSKWHSAAFGELHWCGFMSVGKPEYEWCLDDFEVKKTGAK